MNVNREYKASVFSWLFGNPETLRELYGAHASEVLNMLLTEWNWDDALAVKEESEQRTVNSEQ
jgi:hypothetical protein